MRNVLVPPAWLAGLATLLCLAQVPLAGCPGERGPSAAAIGKYVDARGAPHGAATKRDAPKPATRVRVTVVSGSGLPDLDTGPGVTDPFVELDYEGQRFKTSIAEGNQEPEWGDSFILDVHPGGILEVKLWDHDSMSSNELLGTTSIEIPAVLPRASEAVELAFRGGEQGAVKLTIVGIR